jgi:SP family sugar:H+ symporter-like MFS transporter
MPATNPFLFAIYAVFLFLQCKIVVEKKVVFELYSHCYQLILLYMNSDTQIMLDQIDLDLITTQHNTSNNNTNYNKNGDNVDLEQNNEKIENGDNYSTHPNTQGQVNEIQIITLPDNFVRSFVPLVCYSAIIAIGGLIFGFDIGTVGGLVDLPAFVSRFGDIKDLHNTISFKPITKGTIVSISCLGGLVSGGLVNKIIPIAGMKLTIMIAFVLYCTGNLIIKIVTFWRYILIARFINGFALGTFTITCPMYISEISPLKQRGIFVGFCQLFTTIGIFFGSGLNLFSALKYQSNDKLQYELSLNSGIFFTITGFLLILFVPESPHWLIRTKKPLKRVENAIAQIYGYSLEDEKIVEITTNFYDYNSQLKLMSQNNGSNSNSIIKGKPKYLFRVFLGMMLYCFQQFTGINFFFYYGITIFQNVKLKSSYLVPALLSVVNLLFSFTSIYIIAKFKRKTLLIFGASMMSLIMILFTIFGTILKSFFNSTLALIILSCSFIAVFSISWGPVANILVSEMYPPNIKIKAMSFCGSSAWIFNFCIALLIPLLTNKIGLSIGWIFASMTTISAVFVHFFIPETKNVPTSNLDKYYSENGYMYHKTKEPI